MKKLRQFASAVVVVALVAAVGCATVKPVLTKLEHAVDCSAQKVVSQLPGIITDVATDLLSQDYAKLLTDLAQRVGDDVVVCAVAASTAGAKARMAATNGDQPNAAVISQHGEAYLAARDVKFSSPPPPASP